MPQPREIRKRIKSVSSTKQITRAMEMVATSKIKKAQERIEASRPYAIAVMEEMKDIAARLGEVSHPLLEIREPEKKVAILGVTADKGLCGAFNSNIIRKVEGFYRDRKEEGKEVTLLIVGRRGVNYFKFTGYPLAHSFIGISDRPTFENAREIARVFEEMYAKKEVDTVYIAFNHFKSLMEQQPLVYQVLPVPKRAIEKKETGYVHEFLFEPSAEKILEQMLPRYVEFLIYRALLESAASEQGARRTAMKAATDNAEEMITTLTRFYNRARQAQITKEIVEVVSGADALEK